MATSVGRWAWAGRIGIIAQPPAARIVKTQRTNISAPFVLPSERLIHELDLCPHTPDAAIGVIPIEKPRRRSAHHASRRNLRELRMVQGIQGLPTKLQPPSLCDAEGPGKGDVEVLDTASDES